MAIIKPAIRQISLENTMFIYISALGHHGAPVEADVPLSDQP
jgi:hypothetical protein